MSKFLITGIAGFVGPHLARLLIKEGHEVWGMVKGLTPSDKLMLDKVKYWVADLADDVQVFHLFENHKFDGVFHLAGKTYPPTSFKEPVDFFETNALGTAFICEAIKAYQPECVLMNCSTSEVYGATEERMTEDTPLKPQNPYAVSKAAADMYCHERMVNGAIKGFITRAFSHIGPRRPSRYAYSSDACQIAKIIKGEQEPILRVGNLNVQRNVMDVRDVVDVYYQLMLKNLNGDMGHGEVFVICGNKIREYGEYVHMMLKLHDVNVTLETDPKLLRPVDILVQNPDSTKVRKYLDWEPSISIEQTLKDLVGYWLEKV